MIQEHRSHLSSGAIVKFIAFVLLLLLGTVHGTHAQDRSETYSVIGVAQDDTLNVRSGPGEKFSVVTKLPNGYNGIAIAGEVVWNGGDDWVPILFSNAKGWVRPKYLSQQDDAIALYTHVPVRRATVVEPDENAFDESPAERSSVPSASNSNDAVLLSLFGFLAGAIIKNDFSVSSPDESGGQPFSNIWYPFGGLSDRQYENAEQGYLSLSEIGPF